MNIPGTKVIVSTTLDGGCEISLETGMLATKMDGSVVLRCGNIAMLATVFVRENYKKEHNDVFLYVDYREKNYLKKRDSSKNKGNKITSSEQEILISRAIDRAIRSLLPEKYDFDIHICVDLISDDENISADTMATLAASAAVRLTKLSFYAPVADVRIARIAGNWVVNPNIKDIHETDINLLVSGTGQTILAVEGDMLEVGTMEIIETLKKAHEAIKVLCQLQDEIVQKADRNTCWKYIAPTFNKKL